MCPRILSRKGASVGSMKLTVRVRCCCPQYFEVRTAIRSGSRGGMSMPRAPRGACRKGALAGFSSIAAFAALINLALGKCRGVQAMNSSTGTSMASGGLVSSGTDRALSDGLSGASAWSPAPWLFSYASRIFCTSPATLVRLSRVVFKFWSMSCPYSSFSPACLRGACPAPASSPITAARLLKTRLAACLVAGSRGVLLGLGL
jgi:hypothetical protein